MTSVSVPPWWVPGIAAHPGFSLGSGAACVQDCAVPLIPWVLPLRFGALWCKLICWTSAGTWCRMLGGYE